jgi:hypothetical protein
MPNIQELVNFFFFFFLVVVGEWVGVRGAGGGDGELFIFGASS